MRSPLASPFRGGWRNLTPMRGRGRGGGQSCAPLQALSDFVIAHRGGASIRPENTYSAYADTLAAGMFILDTDVRLTSNSGLAVIHDSTVDRTTTSSGNVSSLTKAQFTALTSDPSSFLSASGYSDETPLPTQDALFELYRNRVIHVVEAKTAGSGPLIVDAAQAAGIDSGHLLLQSFDQSYLADGIAAGYPCCYLVSDLTSITPATVKAAGIDYVGANTGLDSVTVAACHAAGLTVGAWTYSRRSEWATLMAAGVDFVWSDHGEWTAGLSSVATTDPYATKKWWPGSLTSPVVDRGSFLGTDEWGMQASTATAYRGAVQGWACPIASPTNYSIQFDMAIDTVNAADLTRWGSVYLAATDDREFGDLGGGAAGVVGYHFLIKANGALLIYRVNSSAAVTLLTSGSVTAPTLTTFYTYTVTVTPTTVSIVRSDVPGTVVSVSDATHRGAYFWLGRNGSTARWRNVTIA